MAFLISSAVRNIEVYVDANGIGSILWDYLDGANWRGTSYSPESDRNIRSIESGSEMGILQQKWAAGTLQDDMGDEVTVTVRGSDVIRNLDDLIAYGFPNFFDPEGFAKWEEMQKFLGFAKNFGEMSYVNGANKASLQFGIEMQDYVREGEGFVRIEAQWEPSISPGPAFSLRHEFDLADTIEADDLDSYTPMIGLRNFLNRHRTAGAAMGTDHSLATSWTNRTFTINTSAAGKTGFAFHIHQTAWGIDDNGVYQWAEFICTVSSGSYDREVLAAALDINEVITGESAPIRTPVKFGGRGQDLDVNRVIMQDAEMRAFQGVIHFILRDLNRAGKFWVPLGTKRILDHKQLEMVSLASGDTTVKYPQVRWSPLEHHHPFVGEVHYSGDPAPGNAHYASMYLRSPIVSNLHGGIIKELYVENQSGSGHRYILRDWNGNEIIRMEPGETALVRSIYDADGHGRVNISVPPRRLEQHGVSVGTLPGVGSGHYDFDTNHWARSFTPPRDTDGISEALVWHEDAFGIDSRDSQTPNGQAWNAANAVLNPRSLLIRRSGYLRFAQSVQIAIDDSVTGNIPSGSRLALYRKRGSTLTLLAENILNEEVSSNITRQLIEWRWEGSVEGGDILFPLWILLKSATMAPTNIQATLFNREVELAQQITVEYED